MECSGTPFEDVEHGAKGHFRLLFYEAIFRIIDAVRRLSAESGRAPEACLAGFAFLRGYFEELRPCLPEGAGWRETRDWWRERIGGWEAYSPVRLPLRSLAAHAGLTNDDV